MNGQVYESPSSLIAVVQYLKDNQYCVLTLSNGIHGKNVLTVITDPDGSGKWLYSEQEIKERMRAWRLLESYQIQVSD